MGIYLPNMEMPFCCLVCPCSGTDNTEDGNEVWICEASEMRQLATEDKIERRPDWCPLIPCEDGIKDVVVNIFDEEEVYTDCTVQVLRNSLTGDVSVGWWRNNMGDSE